jgi:Aminotransferase class-III
VFVTPFPYWHQLGLSPETPQETLVDQCLHQLQLVLSQQTAPKDTAALIVEPVIGEGGYVPAPPAFLAGLRDICDKNGLLLVFDEVQTGFGRTGKYFATEHSGVRPDVIVMAKGLANGFPLSGIVSRRELMDKQPPGSMVRCLIASSRSIVLPVKGSLHRVYKGWYVRRQCSRLCSRSRLRQGHEGAASPAQCGRQVRRLLAFLTGCPTPCLGVLMEKPMVKKV